MRSSQFFTCIFKILFLFISFNSEAYNYTSSVTNFAANSNRAITFPGTCANATSDATLTIYYRGRPQGYSYTYWCYDKWGSYPCGSYYQESYYNFLNEFGNSLYTIYESGISCASSYSSTTVTIPAATINAMAANGSIDFSIYAWNALGCGPNDAYMTLSYSCGTPPVASFNVTPDCEDKSISFTDLSTAGSGTITSYDWDFGDGNFSSDQNPSHTFTNPGDYLVTLTVINSGNISDDTTVMVTVKPTPTITAITGNTTICPNTSTILTAVSDPTSDVVEWFDSNTGGILLFTGSDFNTGNITGTVDYWVQATLSGCTGTRYKVTVIATDVTVPVITNCPSNIAVNNDVGSCGAIVNYTFPTATDNCSTVTLSLTSGLASGALFPPGVTTVTYTATDGSGNISTCSFTVTVTDTELPSVICPANIEVNNDVGTCGAVVNYSVPVGTDNCSGSTTARIVGLGSGVAFPIGITTETYTVTDASGNTSSCSFTVTVTDTELPSVICPANILVNNDVETCGAVVNYTAPVGTDNCSGVATALSTGLGSGATFPIGTTTEIYTVTDASGNTSTCSFTVTVTDTELPLIVCPADIAVNNDIGNCGAVVNYTVPVGTDNCSGVATALSAGLGSGAIFPIGTTTETYTVSDASGNTSFCSFTVTVTDTELPSIICPANIAVNNSIGTCGAVVNYSVPVGTDNCSGATTALSAGLGSGTTFPIGTTTETYTVTDASGNISSCSFTVTVTDSEAPIVSCQGNIVECSNNNGRIVNYLAPTATDNCGSPAVSQTAGLASGSLFPIGTTTNTFSCSDVEGNVNTCSFTVTINDLPLVVTTTYNDICINASPLTLSGGSPSGGSYSGTGIISNTFYPATAGLGTHDIMYTYSDQNQCSNSVITTITVIDAPVVTLQNFADIMDDATSFSLSGGEPQGGIYSGTSVTSNIFDPLTAGIGSHEITYTYENAQGCSNSSNATIQIIDDKRVVVYNTFTPNGDGMHETWEIKNIEKYPRCTVEIFNRWGSKVFKSSNYKNDWDGSDLPAAAYYYIVNLGNGEKSLTGTITIIR